MSEGPVGSVMVVGAGIGGMQASLDLAESGFKVYLLDRSPAIGGVMAQLDKTFPTDDCAMCILSPKLVECGRHRNIEVMTYAQLESVAGDPGNLTVRVRQRPRYVDVDACTGCGDCAEVCPISRPDRFNIGFSERRAVYKLYPQAVPNAYVIEKQGVAPCRDACPADQRAQGYIALIRERRFADAYRTIKEDNPFPAVCGRVCNHACETACSRGQVDEPVSIMRLKRFVADWAFEHPEEVAEAFRPRVETDDGHTSVEEIKPTEKQIAIVGSGPAGLTVAQDLKLKGHDVTVFETLPVAGGMMRVGIPEYRLPAEILQREIDEIIDLGIDLRLNTRVEDVVALKEEYDAVFVGIGAHEDVRPPVPGIELPQMLSANDFLREVNMEYYPDLMGKKVIVLGGGDVAMDAACTALRIGTMQADERGGEPPEVRVAYRRTDTEMPAQEAEYRQAMEDGVIFDWLVSPVEVDADEEGNVCGLTCCRMELGEPDQSGRRRPVPIEGSEFMMEADVVISAIGARPNLVCVPERVARTPNGRQIAVDENTMMTNVEGVFAGGDAVTGMAFVVDAIGAGHKAARAIDAYVRGAPMPAPEPKLPVAELTEEDIAARREAGEIVELPRACTLVEADVDERVHSLCEVSGPVSEEEAVAEAQRCLQCGICSECNQCVYACQKDCIDHHMREEVVELQVGAVVLTPGLETMPGDVRPEFGYGRSPNVLTSIEFERMLSASGPWGGEVQRPSDGEHPRKVAFIQCVGSRDVSCGRGYCSSVCCMYATKEAVIAKEHDPNVEPTIFYMDIRSFGKDFERYVERAEQERGVRYVRSMVSSVTEVPGTGNLRVKYATSDGKNVEEEFDLVVLSVGLRPPEGAQDLASRLEIGLNEFGFAEPSPFLPGQTTRPGIFVAGPFSEPKDIPETVIEASCAAAQASALLAEGRGSKVEGVVYPPERDVSDEDARVGVFICHCGINIGSVVRVPEVVEYASSLPGVVYAEQNLYTCSQDTQQGIQERIEEHGLNRVVVASCTPRTHEPLFQETLRGAGLNPHLFEMTNIREQDSWVHRDNPEAATEKAQDLVAMAVAKARNLRSIPRRTFEIVPHTLVIGGGLAGMTAALSIAEQGFGVTLVEREAELGGNLRHIHTAFPDSDGASDPQALLQRTIEAVSAETRISVLTEAEIVNVGGHLGQYRTMVQLADGRQEEVQHGAIVVATGARQIEPHEYLYGADIEHTSVRASADGGAGARVITQRELEERITSGDLVERMQVSDGQPVRSVVMIQCVGSRDEEHPYCSRICCTEAIKNALVIKDRSPQTDVYILYRDIRTFGFKERYYRQAREKGVVFLEYDKDEKPAVRERADVGRASADVASAPLQVDVAVQPEGEVFTLDADLVVLSAGIEPDVDNGVLAQVLKVPLNEDGFFLEAHVKLRPLDFAAAGVYLCGMAHSPRFLDETIAQAQGAAMRVVTMLSRKELEAPAIVARVDPLLCTNCGQCIEVCPYDARVSVSSPSPPLPLPLRGGGRQTSYVQVIDVLCQGCGACVTACPNKACQQKGFEMPQVYSMLDALAVEVPEV